MNRFYRRTSLKTEKCFYIETSAPLTPEELLILRWLLAETFEAELTSEKSRIAKLRKEGSQIVEIGPRLNFETASSSNAVAICRACGLTKVTRLEVSRRSCLILTKMCKALLLETMTA